MIAAVKGWHAAWAALLVLCPLRAKAADDLASAARELAAKTAEFAGAGTAVASAWRNASSLSSSELEQAKAAFETALRRAGARPGESSAVQIQLTLSENPTQYLLVEEARRGDERQVWIASWPRGAPPGQRVPPGVSLDRKLVWEQDEQILDLAFPAAGMLVLSPSRLALYTKVNGQWQLRQNVPLAPEKPWPRDLRGRLRVTGANFQVWLPGTTCNGSVDPLAMECRASDQPWVLESGSMDLLLANFASARNYFDGRVVIQTGSPRAVPPFYSAAAVEERSQTYWALALVDGHTQLFDAALNLVSGNMATAWGSDIAGVDARCGPPSQVLATRADDGSDRDAIQSFAISGNAPLPVTAPSTFSGPVTALWTSGGTSAIAVARDLSTGRYAAYVITVACGS
jgi:hypothetical protein